MTLDRPEVQKAVEFLRLHQRPDGSWWGRWTNNDVPATAWVLIGLSAVGIDANEDWVQRGVEWLVSRQNEDGGWGELPDSYRHPELAGIAPSMTPVTGLVLVALCDVGLRHDPAVILGARYLLERQRADGSWDGGGFLHTLIPPDTFYHLPSPDHFWPLEGLARVLHDDPPAAMGPTLPEPLRDEFLDRMRRQGDPTADTAAASLFRGGVAEVTALLGGMTRSDAPLPHNLPPALADYFAATAALPDWADPAQIATAQNVFIRHGWEVALSLFHVALPQGYAAGPCARSLCQTRNMLDRARHRIFETAQFLFDVLEPGGLAPGGRGVAACQRVRLLHAAIRHRTAGAAGPDGRPVNQEDMLGTLLLFSVTTLHTLEKLGLALSRDERAAWVHTWASGAG
jgi:hypothetical protein